MKSLIAYFIACLVILFTILVTIGLALSPFAFIMWLSVTYSPYWSIAFIPLVAYLVFVK